MKKLLEPLSNYNDDSKFAKFDDNVIYTDVMYGDKKYTLKVILTNHYVSRATSRVISLDNSLDLIKQGIRYLIDISDYNYHIHSRYYKRYTKLISSVRNFYVILQSLWYDDKYKSVESNSRDYDIEVIMVTTALNLFKNQKISRLCRARNNRDTFAFNV